MARKKFIAGNWKMYKTVAEALSFAEAFKALYVSGPHDVAILAPYTQLAALKDAFAGTGVLVGAQNLHFEAEGAYTGEVSAPMLKELGMDYVIIGHSERRQYFAETDETVNKKIFAALSADILPIVCVGESLPTREAGEASQFVGAQVAAGFAGVGAEDFERITIAYEPIWAIGTGLAATAEQAEDMCAFIRGKVAELFGDAAAEAVRIQYGGSVKPDNAAEISAKPDVDGALVGGASLVPEQFFAICSA